MNRFFFIGLGAIVVLILGLISYGTYLNQEGEAQIAERMADQSIPLQGAKAQTRQLRPRLSLDTLNLYSDKMTDAVALIDGRITAVHVQKNDHVVRGQTLFTITNEQTPIKIRQADIDILKAENDIINADTNIRKAETALAKTKTDLDRYTRLHDRDAVTVERYEEAVAAHNEALANLDSARIQKDQYIAQRNYYVAQKDQLAIEESHADVGAPIDGEVLILYRPQGSYVSAGTAMALIGNFRTLYFSMAIENETARLLTVGEKSTLFFNRSDFSKIYDTEYESGNAGTAQQFTANIIEITPPLDEPAALRKVVWEVNNSAGLLEPQTYGNVSIEAFVPHNCLTVPLTAMIDPSRSAVFIVNQDRKLVRRSIRTGVDDGTFVEILDGLNEGDIVVTSGTGGLEEGMKASLTLEGGGNNG